MMLSEVDRLLSEALFGRPGDDRLFNPYADCDPALDRPDAPAVRQANLRRFLAAFPAPPPVFVAAEAPGPWGCRFSGVPVTSQRQLLTPGFPVQGEPSSLAPLPHLEYTAGIYWRVVGPYFPQVFTWNAVPLHPHRPGAPLSIRTPGPAEVRAWTGLLAALVGALRPARIVALGRVAERALAAVGAPAVYVRHPSQGGARRFAEGMAAVLAEAGLTPNPPAHP